VLICDVVGVGTAVGSGNFGVGLVLVKVKDWCWWVSPLELALGQLSLLAHR
jgi:hypothetical protein